MEKTIYLLTTLLLLLLSCESKKNLASPIVRPVLNTDSIRPGNLDIVTRLFAPDTSGLKKFSARRKTVEKGQVASPGITRSIPPVVVRGTNITNSAVSVSSVHPGIDRAKRYEFTHRDIPEAFDGLHAAFIPDSHYKSLLREKRLESLVRLFNARHVDVLLTGGDYQEGCQFVPELFAALARVRAPLGTHGAMENSDCERCHGETICEMKRHGTRPLEHQPDTLRHNGEQIILTDVHNLLDLANNGVSPTPSLPPADFVILSVYTPDYAEDVSITNSDLVLTGHTHGGQVRTLGYTPIIPSYYGSRFLTRLKYNSAKIPVIVTSGTGASNKNIRIGAPARIVVITLYHLRNEQL